VGAFVAVMLVVGRRVIPGCWNTWPGTGSRELFTLCVLAIALGVAFGAAALFGVSLRAGRVLRRHAAQRVRTQPQGGRRFAAAARCLRGAVLRLGGHAVQPAILVDHPLLVLATWPSSCSASR
jgi:CPA2 family monovalent cation:H+ antiporter-2